jgi:hypothetical protein
MLALLCLLVSCGGKEAVQAPVEPAPVVEVAEEASTAPDPQACMEQCLESNAMRAEAWEAIRAGCLHTCGLEEDPGMGNRDLEAPLPP